MDQLSEVPPRPIEYAVVRPDGTRATFVVGAPWRTSAHAHEAASAALAESPDRSVLERDGVVLAIRTGVATPAAVAHARAGSRGVGRLLAGDVPPGWCTLDVAAERHRVTKWTLLAALKHARTELKTHPTRGGAPCPIVRDVDVAPALQAHAVAAREREQARLAARRSGGSR